VRRGKKGKPPDSFALLGGLKDIRIARFNSYATGVQNGIFLMLPAV